MNIEISGKPRSITKFAVQEAANFYADKLLPKKMNDDIYLDINFSYSIKTQGCCSPTVDNVRPRDFLIEIKSNLTFRKTLVTLAHEMVHLKQFAKGELFQYLKSKKIKWNNPRLAPFIAESGLYDEESLDYHFQPWEIEAYGLEWALYLSYQKHLKETQNE